MRYVPLHDHTIYSVKDAIAKCIDYVKRIHEYNGSQTQHRIEALAITEHSNMFSYIENYEACNTPINETNGKVDEKDGKTIKPIYGNEIYHVDTYEGMDKFTSKDRYHLVLLAKNEIGMKNLIAITSEAGMHKVKGSTKDFQMVEESFLDTHGEGIIGLSACMGGKIGQHIINGKYDEAKALALHFNEIFDEFYLELQPHDTLPEQMLINEQLKQMSIETGLKLVITSDSHYVYKEDKEYHNIIKQIDHMPGFTVDAHLWTPDELIDWCNKYNYPLEAIENTALIADQCNVDIKPKDSKGLMPSYECPQGYDEDSYLIKVANDGFREKFITNKKIKDIKEYITRMNYELNVIIQMGFSGYFLILWDWFRFCKKNKIPLGPGRGSAAGSLVCYFLDITKIDPIENGLIFERFLNPQRIEEPDVDTDISKLHRGKAIQYLKAKYGDDYVCQIATYGQYKLKNTIKAVLSAERGYSADYQNNITKQIPDMLDGNPVTLKLLEDIEENPDKYDGLTDREMSQAASCLAMLRELFVEHKDVELAVQKVCGAISSIGIHAGGVVISSKPLGEHVPLMKGGAAAVLRVCQTNMDGIHFMHGLKIDALGLKTLSQIRMCMDISDVGEEWLEDEDTSEKEVYDFLIAGNTANVFQMAKHMPSQMIKDFLVNSLAGLNAVNAGNRPGPLAKGEDGKSMVDRYAEVVANGGKIPSIHPLIDPILEETNGQLWYQEQLQKIGQVMAGYSLGNADLRIRKVVAKKLKKKIPEIRNEFVYGKKSLYDKDGNVTGVSDEDSPYCIGAVRNGFDEGLALKLFKDMEAFAAYCFNKSHSAAYGFVAYRTAWLSYHYPVEWSIACMTLDTIDGKNENVIATLNNCKKRNIKVLPPDINESDSSFSVAYLADGTKAIRYGLLGIKGVGNGVLDLTKRLIEKDGKFTSFANFLERTVDNKNNYTLRQICLDDPDLHTVGEDKKGNKSVKINNPYAKRNIIPLILAGAFDSLEPNRHKLLNEYIDFRGVKKEEEEKKSEEDYHLKDKLSYEFELLGYYVSQHPLDGPSFPYVDLDQVRDGANVEVAGILKACTTAKTKKGDKYYKLKIELKDGRETAVNVFKNAYEKNPNSVKGLTAKAKTGKEILIIKGKVSIQWNNINANSILRVYSKAEELEDTEIPEVEDGIPTLSLPAKNSPMDMELMQTVG